MKRPKRIKRADKKAKFKTIANWLEARRKANANQLNEELKAGSSRKGGE